MVQRQVTTNFGWTADASAYLVPGGVITTNGEMQGGEKERLRVDLSDEEQARYLDMKQLDPDALARVKRHAWKTCCCCMSELSRDACWVQQQQRSFIPLVPASDALPCGWWA